MANGRKQATPAMLRPAGWACLRHDSGHDRPAAWVAPAGRIGMADTSCRGANCIYQNHDTVLFKDTALFPGRQQVRHAIYS